VEEREKGEMGGGSGKKKWIGRSEKWRAERMVMGNERAAEGDGGGI